MTANVCGLKIIADINITTSYNSYNIQEKH